MKYLYVLMFALFAATLMYGCQQAKPEASSQALSLPVNIEKVSHQRPVNAWVYSGNIKPLRESNANFTIPGKITFLPLEEGDFVNQGQLIGNLDPADYHIELKRVEAQLLEAKDAYERFKQLYEKKSLPEKDYISAQAAYQQVQAAREMIAKKIADTRLSAPTTGIVMEKMPR
ncbi:MAG: biotin/lipoyl-binding protein [Bacteroidia bacterium]|nr:biotin/lipoyl-binding protein [Bacteroidia bacterium]